MFKKLQSKMFLAVALIFAGTTLFAQTQLNIVEEFGAPIMDINSSGQGILKNGYYDFETNQLSLPEGGVEGTCAINDNGDVFGFIVGGSGQLVAGIRKDGEWTPFPDTVPIDIEYVLYDISENGKWAVGQTSWNMETDEAWGFIYNTETEEYRVLSSPLYKYGAAYGVNNDGIAVGWMESLETGFRMPVVFMPDETIVVIHETEGAGSQINNKGMVAGGTDDFPFIYDINTGELTTFTCPDDCLRQVFTGISEDGVAVGFNEDFFWSRIPIIYIPETRSAPITLSDYLAGFEIDASFLSGTAYRISNQGNYLGGFTDGPAMSAMGWAVRLGDSTDSTDSIPSLGDTFEITLYPNPAQEEINFRTATPIQYVEIYNLTGQKIATQKIVDGSVNINQLPSGTYMVKVFAETGQVNSFKMVKK